MAVRVAALERRPVAYTFTWPPPKAYEDMDQRVRCALNWIPGCDPLEAAVGLQASHVLIDLRFPYYNAKAPDIYGAPDGLWGTTAAAEWLTLEYEDATVRLYSIAKGEKE